MRLDRLTIDRFKNLKNLSVDFDESSPYTVLVGENGAGKSNLIEAITFIFRNLDLNITAPFGYELFYRCRANELHIKAEGGRFPSIRVRPQDSKEDFAPLPRRAFMDDDRDGRPLYRPAFVFGYYSGPSDRLAALYERHRERFYDWIIRPPARRKQTLRDPNSLRRLFYAQTLHGQFALLAFFMTTTDEAVQDRQFLRDHLQIDELDSVLFAVREPPWPGRAGDPRFWHAEGEVRQFLSVLYDSAFLPMRMDRRIPFDLKRNPSVESLYLFIPDAKSLERVYKTYRDQYAFFTALESTHLSKLLGEVRTRVRMTPAGGGGEVTYRDLSEGEQQLLLVLGLLKFTARDEALFLLDEPDTHLNPVWSAQYLQFLSTFIRQRESCHIIMSSHDPLVFAGLTRSEVRILRRDAQGFVIAEEPDRDPRGMGFGAILTSDLFRLRTTLDPETQADLDRHRILAMKESLTAGETEELEKLSLKIRQSGLSQAARDPLYERFLRAWTAQEDPAWVEAVQLSPEQLEARAKLAADIVKQLKEEDSGQGN